MKNNMNRPPPFLGAKIPGQAARAKTNTLVPYQTILILTAPIVFSIVKVCSLGIVLLSFPFATDGRLAKKVACVKQLRLFVT